MGGHTQFQTDKLEGECDPHINVYLDGGFNFGLLIREKYEGLTLITRF